MSIDVNVQNDLVIVTETTEDIVVNVSNAAGPQGPAGAAGVGVPVGGSTGQVLKKFSATNYDTYWAEDASGLTSVGLSVPTGLSVTNSPLTTNGTIAVGLASGYSIPTTASQATWDAAYNDSIVSAAVTGTTTKTLTLTQQDAGTITATWSDLNTDAVTSVFGRTGAVVATEGDYTLTQLGDVTLTSPTNGQVLKYNGTTWVNNTDTDTGLTSVGISMPSAFNVANSPLTSNGTLAVTGAGLATQYIRGDGQLATFPSTASGGSSVNYYLNGSINASVGGYKQLDNNAIIGSGTNFSLSGNGLIAQFLTDAGNPNRVEIPGGAWNFELYFSSSSNGGSEGFYVELLKYNGTTFTSIASSSTNPEQITGGTSTDLYLTSLAVPTTALLVTDRLAIRVYIVNNAAARTVTLKTEDNNLCEIITTFAGGVSSLNGLTANTQYLATGTTGSDFNINSVTDTHTFNLPIASGTNTGKLSNTDWTTFNSKQNAITLTTTGSSGAATLIGATLNIPQYADQFVGTVTSVAALTIGTTGTDLSSTVANGTTTPVITLQVPTASATNRGALSSADWTTFNNKQNTITNPVTGTGTVNYITKWAGGSALGSSVIYDNGTNVGVGNTNPQVQLSVTSSGNNYGLFIGPDAGNTTGKRLKIGYYGTANYSVIQSIQDGVTATSLVLQPDGGNLLVGTTTDSGEKLQVSGSVLATSFIKSGGTSSQFLKADGSVDSTTYQPLLTNPVTGTGTTNYLPKWTSGSALGNSLVYDNGTNVGIGTSIPTQKLHVIGNAIFNNSSFGSANIRLIGVGTTTGFDIISDNDNGGLWNRDNSYMYFGTNNTERMRITSGGNLLLNYTTDTGEKLQVNGSGRFTGQLNVAGLLVTNNRLWIPANNPISDWISSSLTAGYSATNGYGWINGAGSLILGTNGVDRLNIASTGAATFSSSVTASSFIKSGGTSSQILAADGSVITAGTNITISGGTISSSGGGGGSVDELQVALLSQVYG